MTWNIWGGSNWTAVVDLAAREEVDLLALQEVDRHFGGRTGWRDVGRAIAHRLDYHLAFAPGLELPGPTHPRQLGNSLLSREPLTEVAHCTLSPDVEWDGENPETEPRTLLCGELEMDGARICAGSVHLGHTPDHRSSAVRRRQVERMLELLRRPGTDGRPIVVGGDFNARPGSPEIGLVGRCLSSAEPTATPTWPVWEERAGAVVRTVPRDPIDYVFHSRELVCTTARVAESEASDHLPLIVDLELS